MKSNSKLQNGLIPAHTECPFKSECGMHSNGTCHHSGVLHTVDFSCGAARAFDICQRYKTVDTVAK